MKRLVCGILVVAACFLCSSPVLAGNGLLPVAAGARSAGMAGVDLAVARDATALLTNPAGLIRLDGHRLDLGSALEMPTIEFSNDLNDVTSNQLLSPVPFLAYGHRFAGTPYAMGIGIFGNEGYGAADLEMDHAIYGEDTRYFSRVENLELRGAFVAAPHRTISLGLAPHFALSKMEWDFPYTRHPKWVGGYANPSNHTRFGEVLSLPVSEGGFGYDEATFRMKLLDATAYHVGFTFGALWQPLDWLDIGFAYSEEANMNYRGHARFDMKAQLRDAEQRVVDEYLRRGINEEDAVRLAREQMIFYGIEGEDLSSKYTAELESSLPRNAGLGFAFRPLDALLIGLDLKWINWAESMERIKFRLDHPNLNIARTVFGGKRKKGSLEYKWHDQYVGALGAEYAFIKDVFWGRAGYNYGTLPVDEDYVVPIMAGYIQHHVAAGLGGRVGPCEVNAAFEYGLPNTVTSSEENYWANEYNDSETTQSSMNAHLMLSFLF